MALFTKDTSTLRIFMKSGNTIEIDKVEDYTFRYRGDDIVGVEIKQHKTAKNKLLIGATNLSQIEAVVTVAE